MTDDRTNPNVNCKPVRYPIPSDRAWLDGQLITTICRYTWLDTPVPHDEIVMIATNNPKRVAVGFVRMSNLGNCVIGPYPDIEVTNNQFAVFGNQAIWYHLHTYYSLVNSEWYALSDADTTIRTIQIERI